MSNGFIKNLISVTGPSTAMQELLYGFIMSLIFVYATRFDILSFDDPIYFVYAVIGMCVTWGIIDGIIFYFLGVCDQRRFTRLVSSECKDSREDRRQKLADEFAASPLDVLTDEQKMLVCDYILDKEIQTEENAHLDRVAMAMSSLGCLIFTVITLIPIILPVLLMENFMDALTVASLLSSAVLFLIGFFVGPHLGLNGFTAGLTILGISVLIAVVSVFTGG